MGIPTWTFKVSLNNHHSSLPALARLQNKAEYMFLTPKVKAHFGLFTLTVECDTPQEREILKKLSESLLG